MIWTAAMTFSAADAGFVINTGLTVLLKYDGVFGTVHVAATGYTSTAKVGDFVIDLYTRRACFINYA
jgi:hypothetical protein